MIVAICFVGQFGNPKILCTRSTSFSKYIYVIVSGVTIEGIVIALPVCIVLVRLYV